MPKDGANLQIWLQKSLLPTWCTRKCAQWQHRCWWSLTDFINFTTTQNCVFTMTKYSDSPTKTPRTQPGNQRPTQQPFPLQKEGMAREKKITNQTKIKFGADFKKWLDMCYYYFHKIDCSEHQSSSCSDYWSTRCHFCAHCLLLSIWWIDQPQTCWKSQQNSWMMSWMEQQLCGWFDRLLWQLQNWVMLLVSSFLDRTLRTRQFVATWHWQRWYFRDLSMVQAEWMTLHTSRSIRSCAGIGQSPHISLRCSMCWWHACDPVWHSVCLLNNSLLVQSRTEYTLKMQWTCVICSVFISDHKTIQDNLKTSDTKYT